MLPPSILNSIPQSLRASSFSYLSLLVFFGLGPYPELDVVDWLRVDSYLRSFSLKLNIAVTASYVGLSKAPCIVLSTLKSFLLYLSSKMIALLKCVLMALPL